MDQGMLTDPGGADPDLNQSFRNKTGSGFDPRKPSGSKSAALVWPARLASPWFMSRDHGFFIRRFYGLTYELKKSAYMFLH